MITLLYIFLAFFLLLYSFIGAASAASHIGSNSSRESHRFAWLTFYIEKRAILLALYAERLTADWAHVMLSFALSLSRSLSLSLCTPLQQLSSAVWQFAFDMTHCFQGVLGVCVFVCVCVLPVCAH